MATDRVLAITTRIGADLHEFLRRVDVSAANGYLRFSRSDDPTRHVEIETDHARGTKVFMHRPGGNITGCGPYCDLNEALDVAARYVKELLVD